MRLSVRNLVILTVAIAVIAVLVNYAHSSPQARVLADCSHAIASHQWNVVWSETKNLQSASVLRTAPAAADCYRILSKSDSGSAHYSDVVAAVDMFVAIAIADHRLGNIKKSQHAAAAALALLNGIQNDYSGSRLAQKYALDDRNIAQMLLDLPPSL